MTTAEMVARIAQLEAQLAEPRPRTGRKPDADKLRRKQFRLDAWKRAHLHLAINRYYC